MISTKHGPSQRSGERHFRFRFFYLYQKLVNQRYFITVIEACVTNNRKTLHTIEWVEDSYFI